MITHTKNITYEYAIQGAAVSRSVFNKKKCETIDQMHLWASTRWKDYF